MPAPDADPRTAPTPAPDRPGRRRWLVCALLAVVALLAALVFGVTTATAESSFGPHEARYDVTTDATVTVDLGPLGTLQIDSPLPLGLGARVTVEEIPADVDALHGVDTLQALTGDLSSYLQFFTGPQATIEDAARALVANALWRTLAALAVLVAAWTAGWWLLGAARRAELGGRLAPHAAQLTAGGLAVVLVGTLVTASERGDAAQRTASQRTSAVFDGTPLEGARITGRLGGIVDTYGGLVVKAFQDNEDFYDRADGALVAAWDDWEGRRATVEAAADDQDGAASAGEDPVPGATGTAGATATAGASASPAPEESTDEEAEPLTLLVISDLHCNVGMAPLITSLTEMSGAEVVLDAGDTTMNGTSVEQYCVTTFARAIPSGVDLVTAPGNHDSAETTAQYARAGATVLDGGVIDVRGMRILGDKDPKATRLITTQTQDESYAEVGERLSEVACEDADGVDLVLFHNPRTAPALLADGCVPALVSGHMHTRTDPAQIGEGIRYISSSTAGAQENEPRIGPLKGTAEMTILRWDPESRQILDWQLVEIGTDASAVVHDPEPWPAVVPEDEAEDEAPSATPTDAATEPAAG
ncbi:metallophosphoesterase [Cellulosimicrobium cellulans]|uniref:metallophosphoesterase n=1 Tax=Cellulosimicrobium cellulans TaxID=1710 RepID=UPI00130ECD39|nr:metallophosphoesterase [Cellulosimicrobium cellulans]